MGSWSGARRLVISVRVRLSDQQKLSRATTEDSKPRPWLGWALLGGLIAVWFLSVPKPNAVLGRLNYLQFWLSVVLLVSAASFFVVRQFPIALRRAVGFRLAAVAMGLAVALSLCETIAFLWPVKHQMDNPWYLVAGGGTADSVDLPFERPPHLKWEGMSRGDLALLNGDDDPYARRVTFETDREGFRNSRDIERADLITIGDSFTEAGNVMEKESFTALVGEQLGLSARNLGRAGYTTATELIVLKKHGLKCQPKLVVWQVAEANDLAETQIYTNWVAAGRPRYFDLKPESARFDAWMMRSPSVRIFDLFKERRSWPLGGVFRGEDGVDYPVRFFSMPSLEPPVRTHPGWPAFSEALLEGAALCRSNNIQLLLLLIPTKSRVMSPRMKLTELARAASARSEGDSLGVVLKEFCSAHDIQFVDVTDALLQESNAGRLVYLPYDTHLSPLGHRIVADQIKAKLSSR
jgi:hypothetical protein